jgi:uncharacterized RDD family membrane protein YckC
MKCAYCRAANDSGEERCGRCGRRLQSAPERTAPESYPSVTNSLTSLNTALAPALESLPGGVPLPLKPAEPPEYQPSLFRESTGSLKVVPIPTLTPLHTPIRGNPARRSAPRPTGVRQPRRSSDSQQSLGFADTPGEVRRHPGETIYCDAPVALPLQRILAAAVDVGLVLAALAIFYAVFILAGGEMAMDRQTAPFLIGVAAVIGLFYRALWCLADGDSPGMRFAGLRLVDFDGRRPNRDQRVLRQVASLLSVISAGLGLVWALVDEENLTWHDHISKTFPTMI